MRGGGKRGVDSRSVAKVKIERNVARHVVVELRRAFTRGLFSRNDRGEGIDIDSDRFGGILRLRYGFGDNAGDRIADIAHAINRQRLAPRLAQRRAVAIVQRHGAFERAVTFQIVGAGVDAEHPRHFQRRGFIDGADDAVGVAAPNHHGIGLAGKADVVGIIAPAAQQQRVFLARYRLPNGEFLDR